MPREDTQFKKGNPGRIAGIPNKLARTVKETVLDVFNRLQDDPTNNLQAFAKSYPREFYMIASKLIPAELAIKIPQKIQIEFINLPGNEPIQDNPGVQRQLESLQQPQLPGNMQPGVNSFIQDVEPLATDDNDSPE